MTIADPKKLLRKKFREFGARRQNRSGNDFRGAAEWVFPDGAVIMEPSNPTPAWVAAQVRNCEARYGRLRAEQFSLLEKRPRTPRIDLTSLEASAHARDRLKLMQSQAQIDYREVLNCLRLPERVLWSERHQSWVWVRDRIAVAVVEAGAKQVITTILWAQADLFDLYPRPEEAS